MQRRELLRLSVTLLGAAASASVSRALLADCGQATSSEAAAFPGSQRASVELLADMIIPPTDTPGAVTAGVPDFIETIVREWYTDTERDIFLQGLDALDTYTGQVEGKPFCEASESTRLAALRDQEKLATQYQGPPPRMMIARPKDDENAPFFTKLKELVVLGYYTSEVGATQELKFLPMPGIFNGDFEFSKIGRQLTF